MVSRQLLSAAAVLPLLAQGAGECGSKGADGTAWAARIVNGQAASPCEWRWQACLRTPGQRQCWCGGTLIDEGWVLTAAHCVEGLTLNDIEVVLGEFDHTTSTDGTEVERSVAQAIPHPDYDPVTMAFDFALLRLTSAAPVGDCIGTACLPSEGMTLVGGETCYITGWGTLSSGGSQPRFIQEAAVQTLTNLNCNAKYGQGVIQDSMVCAQGQRSDGKITDGCQGDSGGPMVCESSGRWYLQGVTSWGEDCARFSRPGVWARVTAVLGWMDQAMDDNSGPLPTPGPTPAPAFGAGQMFLVTSGPCTMVDHCVQSPRFPGEYGADERCTIVVQDSKSEPIVSVAFDTENDYDTLTVNGARYSGSAGPAGVRPTSTIVWSSDFLLAGSGWRLCPSSHQTALTPTASPPTPQPPAPQPTSSPPACGLKGADSTPWQSASRLVNGQDATPCEWRWQARFKTASGSCGGTLVDAKWVLTAAHCVDDSAGFSVTLGDFDQSVNSDGNAILLEARRVIRHPQFDETTLNYDFALVELQSAAPQGACVSTACLPTYGDPVAEGTRCFISGWGTLGAGDAEPDRLQEAEVTTLGSDLCQEKYGSVPITDVMLCAQGITIDGQVTDACQGDSGGPLVCENAEGKWELHGVTSFGFGCGDVDFPGVWARVEPVLQWIQDQLDLDTLPPTPSPPWGAGEMWRVTQGPCSVMDSIHGSCVVSPNFPLNYGSAQSCVIEVVPGNSQEIVAQSFEVEEYFDSLEINGHKFTGRAEPSGVVPTGYILWTTDYAVEDAGWSLCSTMPTPAPLPPPPTPPCDDFLPAGQASWYDSFGDDCAWYAEEAGRCEAWAHLESTSNFGVTASDACCACRGSCQNLDAGVFDMSGYDCFAGYWGEFSCGYYDDTDFSSNHMCCECGGGRRNDGPASGDGDSGNGGSGNGSSAVGSEPKLPNATSKASSSVASATSASSVAACLALVRMLACMLVLVGPC